MSSGVKSAKYLSIKLIGFSTSEADKFSAVLDLSEFGLLQHWKITDTFSADFYLLKGVPNTQFINERSQSRCFNYICVDDVKKGNVMLHDRAYVPLLHHLIDLLNRAARKFIDEDAQKKNKASVLTIPPVTEVPVSATPMNKVATCYEPSLFLNELLATETPLALRLSVDALYINPDQQTFYYSRRIEQLRPCFLPDIDLPVERVSSDALNELTQRAGLSARPLKHLVWFAAFTASNGHLMADLSEDDIIRLNEWPYLGVDGRRYIKLATYLKHHVTSLAKAAKEAAVGRALANDFYNASQLAGLIETQPSPPLVDSSQSRNKSSEDKLSFLDKIKNHLKH